MLEHDIAALSDSAKDQYFLTSPAKLQLIRDAADIRETDRVVEIGAGVGTVARVLPSCASLTLVELDERLVPALRSNSPKSADVLNEDGIAFIRNNREGVDVLIANLPNSVARQLVELLPEINFRSAVIAVGSTEPFKCLSGQLQATILTEIKGDDFTPPQPGTSYLVSVRRPSWTAR